jgi:hypothetical protein
MYELLKTIEFKDLTGQKSMLSVLQHNKNLSIRVDITPLKSEEQKKEYLQNKINYIEKRIVETIREAEEERMKSIWEDKKPKTLEDRLEEASEELSKRSFIKKQEFLKQQEAKRKLEEEEEERIYREQEALFEDLFSNHETELVSQSQEHWADFNDLGLYLKNDMEL